MATLTFLLASMLMLVLMLFVGLMLVTRPVR